MKHSLSATLGLCLLLNFCALCQAEDTSARRDIERELLESVARMMRLWPGDYENSAQIAVDRRRGYTSWRDGGHAHVHSSVVEVVIPDVGDNLLYVEDYLDGDPTKIFRQKLYELTTDVDRGAVVLTLHSFREPKKVSGAHKDPSLLHALTREDLKQRPGCQMLFRALGDGYLGAFDYGACTTDTGMVADNRIFIAPGHYWFSDQFRPAAAPRPHAAIDQNWHRLLPVSN